MIKVLDPCCGGRMFYFDKNDERVHFGDIRNEEVEFSEGRLLNINPDSIMDFRQLPFEDNTFYHVVFDPPHLVNAGEKSWLALKYGRLSNRLEEDLKQGFNECMRVLKPNGTLIFKWNEIQISTRKILSLIPYKPLYGHRSGKQANTHWIAFLKEADSHV